MKIILLFASILLMSECAQAASPVSPAESSRLGFDTISLWRSACKGTGPVYSLQIRADGNAVFTGKEHVKTKGRHDGKTSPSALALLSSALREVKLEHMRDRYLTEEDGCGPLPTDHPSLGISVKQGDSTKTVTYYTGCRGPTVPSTALFWLAGTIDFLGNTSDLIQ